MRSGLELAGRYRLEEVLGRGGMGEVWRGVDQRLRRPVAVKLLPLTLAADDKDVARFRREAEIAATLTHPGITTVHDIGEHQDGGQTLLFLVMELMQGRDLRQVIAANPAGLPIDQATDIARQVLDALSAAHGKGVVHRDIKPANLFLLDGGRVKICDFGIARLADATPLTATGGISGTPLYMAPEQIQNGTVDQRTDLYALGCVLYELLTGSPWVDANSAVGAILYQHIDQTPAPPRTRRPELPERLSILVLDLLAKQAGQRPQDAATVLERLTRADKPATAGEDPAHTKPAPPPPVEHVTLNQGAEAPYTPPSPTRPAPPAPPPNGTQRRRRNLFIAIGIGMASVAVVAVVAILAPGGSTPPTPKPTKTPSPTAPVAPATNDPAPGTLLGQYQKITLKGRESGQSLGLTEPTFILIDDFGDLYFIKGGVNNPHADGVYADAGLTRPMSNADYDNCAKALANTTNLTELPPSQYSKGTRFCLRSRRTNPLLGIVEITDVHDGPDPSITLNLKVYQGVRPT